MIAAALFPLLLAASSPPPVSFPGASVAKDPTGRFAIDLAKRTTGEGELRLTTIATGAARPLLPLGRGATVYWSPDGSAVAVAVRRDADHGTVLLFSTERAGETDLLTELARAFAPLPEQRDNRRVLLEALRWLDAKRLRLRLSGVGKRDPEGFSELFDYEVGGKFKRAVF